MSYTGMQYANPGWTNGTPPSLNASNLNDISNALQAVNVTRQERTALGAKATDKLGQILTALKTTTDKSIESISQNVEEIRQTMGNQIESLATLATNSYTKILTGSYVGNGQTTVRVPWPNKEGRDFDEVKLVFVYSTKQDDYNFGIGVLNKIFLFCGYDRRGDYYATYQMWLDDPNYCFKAECDSYNEYNINKNVYTYNYILLG